MKVKLAPELEAIVASVEILSESRFRLEGHAGEFDSDAAGVDLAALLAAELYERWYTRPGPAEAGQGSFLGQREHVDQLSGANNGRGTWQPGWTVAHVESENCLAVERNDLVYYAPVDSVRCDQVEPTAGVACRVWVPKELRQLQPGFYAAVGNADQAAPDELPCQLRLYWHLGAPAAPFLTRFLTSELNRREIPFSLKMPSSPQHYRRADAAVLFLEPGHYRVARPVVRAAYREIRDQLRPEVPRLTFRMASGLGLAEGPADGASFGQHRCGLIARGLVEEFAGQTDPATRRFAAVTESFLAAGLDARRPHLAAGSRSRYRPLAPSDRGQRSKSADTGPESSTPGASVTPPAFSEVAARIGDLLCGTAYRSQGLCNWIGGTLGRPDPETGYPMPAVAALHADLYGGTAGIALFLAELFSVTGDRSHRDTALAAQRQALAAVRGEREIYRPLAFYAGGLGVAWSALRVAELTSTQELAGEADDVLSGSPPTMARPLDVMEGDAGAVLALLRWHQKTGTAALLETALALGHDLLRAVRRDGGAWARRQAHAALPPGEHPPLTGFAHGAAGLGLALLELSCAAGEEELRRAADDAFAYEAACFDDEHANWPDYRPGTGAEPGPNGVPARYMTAWCHGATGIALSRLRAMEIDKERASDYEGPARAGLAATRVHIEEILAEPGADTSLCHGLGGMLDVLLFGADVLAEGALRELATATMQRLVARHAEAMDWPSGQRDRARNPSLFMGLAGIGYTLLRLDNPERVPTVLLPAC